MPSIHVAPDKSYDLTVIAQRFEVDESMTHSPRFPALIKTLAWETAKLAAEKNALRGWHWRSEIPVEIDKSELQYDLGASSGSSIEAQDQFAQLLTRHGKIAFVVKMTFQVPMIRTEVLEPEELAEPDGFVEVLPTDGEVVAV